MSGPRTRTVVALPLLFLLEVTGCGGGTANGGAAASDTAGAATPVRIASVVHEDLRLEVQGVGTTRALHAERVRAPFNGVLQSLDVAVGDHVHKGQHIGSFVAQNSYAALQGARSMVATARTKQEKADAQRALAVARRNFVTTPLTVPGSGVVVGRWANLGEHLSEGDSVISVAATGHIVFVARISQAEAMRVKAGQQARIDLVGRTSPVPGTVHSVLPGDTGVAMTVPVRIDLPKGSTTQPIGVGLLGIGHVLVGVHRDAAVVPRGAVIRNDITGKTRMAVVTSGMRAHWVNVVTGIADSTRIEVVYPPMETGRRVIVSGQVGLPEGAKVVQGPDSAAAGGTSGP